MAIAGLSQYSSLQVLETYLGFMYYFPSGLGPHEKSLGYWIRRRSVSSCRRSRGAEMYDQKKILLLQIRFRVDDY